MLLVALCIVAVFTIFDGINDSVIASRRYFTLLGLMVTTTILSAKALFGKRIALDAEFTAIVITTICTYEAIYAICQWLGFTIPNGYLYVTGHFDNPAGLTACLCAGCPFTLYLWQRADTWKIVPAIFITIMLLAIIASQSRIGIIVMFLLLSNFTMRQYHVTPRWRFLVQMALAGGLLIGGYALKRDSADGRLLIWRCSIDIISDAPWIGHGIGAFKRLYMDYQANYFENNQTDAYSMLADNTLSPFNEYLHLSVCFGIFGMIILISIISLLIKYYTESPTAKKTMAMTSLYCIGGVSLTSYPFSYPFVWVICAIIIVILLEDRSWLNKKSIRMAVCLTMMSVGIVSTIYLCKRIDGEIRWRAAYLTKDLNEYERLMPIMESIPFFLYNYAVELDNAGNKDKSLDVALLSDSMMSNYDLELLLGDLYRDKAIYSEAEKHYIRASLMCPCRFVPLNQLYDLYLLQNDEIKAKQIAQTVIDKPIKVKSRTVTQIRYKMRQALSKDL